MTIGVKLLELSAEYQRAVDTADYGQQYGAATTSRTIEAIGADYEAAIRELLTPSPSPR